MKHKSSSLSSRTIELNGFIWENIFFSRLRDEFILSWCCKLTLKKVNKYFFGVDPLQIIIIEWFFIILSGFYATVRKISIWCKNENLNTLFFENCDVNIYYKRPQCKLSFFVLTISMVIYMGVDCQIFFSISSLHIRI